MNDETLTERQIVAAISWWGSCLRAIRAQMNITAIQVGTFVHALAEILEAGQIEAAGRVFKTAGILSTDYHPDAYLSAALAVAGIEDTTGCVLPWKTVMWFRDGGVQLAEGYGARPRWLLAPTRVKIGRRGPGGNVYRPATGYWQRRAARFAQHDRRQGVLERLLSHGLRCRRCNLPAYAWQHTGGGRTVEQIAERHDFVEPLPSVKWRTVRTALRAIRDGEEEQLFAKVLRS